MSSFNIDYDRNKRIGFPEIIYGLSKDIRSLQEILLAYQSKNENALVTKLQKEKADILAPQFENSFYDEVSGIFILNKLTEQSPSSDIAILSAGTSDLFIVNEAYYTLSFLGIEAIKIQDIGVSGIQRLLNRIDEIRKYKVLIIIAGFEGALPTVVGGLLPQPIIAVPTSVGYGVSEKGQAALNSMLASCANGITVVNIDNGYGAALAAYRIVKSIAHVSE